MRYKVTRELDIPRVGGLRRVGPLYLCGDEKPLTCDRFPFALNACPTCSAGFKPSRQPQIIRRPDRFFGVHEPCAHKTKRAECPICLPQKAPMLLAWLPGKLYTPAVWFEEMKRIGSISWGVARLQNEFVLGKSWVLIVSRKPDPHIFTAFRPTRIEKLIRESQSRDIEYVSGLVSRKITGRWVADDDPNYFGGSDAVRVSWPIGVDAGEPGVDEQADRGRAAFAAHGITD